MEYFDIEKLAKVNNLPQIVFWDKTHAKVRIGCTVDFTTIFKRNVSGVLDKGS